MEKVFAKAEELVGNIKGYVDSKIDLVKLSTAEKSSAVIANIIAGIVVCAVFLLSIVFTSIAASIRLGDWIGKTWAGFLVIAFIYFAIGIIVWAIKGKIIRLPIMNAIIKQLMNKDEDI